MEEGEEDMGEVNATDSWAEEQGGLAGSPSFLPYSVWADDQAHSEDGYPDNLHHLSQTGMRAFLSTPDWARCQSAASPSQHHDQHSHYQEFGKDKEEGEENLCDINSREEEVNRQKEEGRDI